MVMEAMSQIKMTTSRETGSGSSVKISFNSAEQTLVRNALDDLKAEMMNLILDWGKTRAENFRLAVERKRKLATRRRREDVEKKGAEEDDENIINNNILQLQKTIEDNKKEQYNMIQAAIREMKELAMARNKDTSKQDISRGTEELEAGIRDYRSSYAEAVRNNAEERRKTYRANERREEETVEETWRTPKGIRTYGVVIRSKKEGEEGKGTIKEIK